MPKCLDEYGKLLNFDYNLNNYYMMIVKDSEHDDILEITDQWISWKESQYKDIKFYAQDKAFKFSEREFLYLYGDYLKTLSKDDFIKYISYNRRPSRLLYIILPLGKELDVDYELSKLRNKMSKARYGKEKDQSMHDYCYISKDPHQGMTDIETFDGFILSDALTIDNMGNKKGVRSELQ